MNTNEISISFNFKGSVLELKNPNLDSIQTVFGLIKNSKEDVKEDVKEPVIKNDVIEKKKFRKTGCSKYILSKLLDIDKTGYARVYVTKDFGMDDLRGSHRHALSVALNIPRELLNNSYSCKARENYLEIFLNHKSDDLLA
jgi:hypothetical protein